MIRGFYTAGSGMITQNRILDIAGDNMANSRTAGYKRDKAVTSSFDSHLISRMGGDSMAVNLGTISPGMRVDGVSTSFEQGTVTETANPFDLAIQGEGFFTIEQPDGSLQYTRKGEFSLDAQGNIVDANAGMLMGDNGPINTGGKLFSVSPDGGVLVDGAEIDRIQIYNPMNNDNMVRQATGLFADNSGAGQKAFEGQIIQGSIETSNVDMMEEMMGMMGGQRAFQACSQVAKMIDSTLAKTVDLGRMG